MVQAVTAAEPTRAEEILEVAARLFYERGYQSVSTRALARAAGIQGGSLYHHFASKEEMLYRITQYGSEGFFAGLAPILTAEGSFTQRLDRFVRAYVRSYWERRYSIAVLFRESGNLSAEHAEELRQVRRRFQQRFQRFIADGLAAGEFSVPDPKVAGIAILDLLNGIDNWWRTSGRLGIPEVAETYAVLVGQLAGAPAISASGGTRESGAVPQVAARSGKGASL
jgi:TetR/AcrR family transcriptional regulator, cholesterol catabolism regulator